MNNDGKMDKKEFSIAMQLIKNKLKGLEPPQALPPSLKADPAQAGFPGQSMGVAMPGMGRSPSHSNVSLVYVFDVFLCQMKYCSFNLYRVYTEQNYQDCDLNRDLDLEILSPVSTQSG